jgi:hypothetical protein
MAKRNKSLMYDPYGPPPTLILPAWQSLLKDAKESHKMRTAVRES